SHGPASRKEANMICRNTLQSQKRAERLQNRFEGVTHLRRGAQALGSLLDQMRKLVDCCGEVRTLRLLEKPSELGPRAEAQGLSLARRDCEGDGLSLCLSDPINEFNIGIGRLRKSNP